MAQIVGSIPEFDSDASVTGEQDNKEVVQPTEVTTEDVTKEMDTPAPPAEKPDEQPPVVDTTVPSQAEALKGLQDERIKLLKEISELRGVRRELKEEKLATVNQQIDELKDLHPEDITVVERIMRAKGMMSKEEVNAMFYNSVKKEEEDKFLAKYPEYRPENDPGDTRWKSFLAQVEREKELGYTMPKNPHLIGQFMERIHREIAPRTQSARSIPDQKRRAEIAGVGGGGAQRASSHGKLDPERRAMYERGGWSEEEIKNIEARLPE